jgi:hypothetical protein
MFQVREIPGRSVGPTRPLHPTGLPAVQFDPVRRRTVVSQLSRASSARPRPKRAVHFSWMTQARSIGGSRVSGQRKGSYEVPLSSPYQWSRASVTSSLTDISNCSASASIPLASSGST